MKKILIAVLAVGLFCAPALAVESTTTQAPENVKIEKIDLSKAKTEQVKEKAPENKKHKNVKKHPRIKKEIKPEQKQ